MTCSAQEVASANTKDVGWSGSALNAEGFLDAVVSFLLLYLSYCCVVRTVLSSTMYICTAFVLQDYSTVRPVQYYGD